VVERAESAASSDKKARNSKCKAPTAARTSLASAARAFARCWQQTKQKEFKQQTTLTVAIVTETGETKYIVKRLKQILNRAGRKFSQARGALLEDTARF
jgi:hypothetical protein